jgi:hypothetical protein
MKHLSLLILATLCAGLTRAQQSPTTHVEVGLNAFRLLTPLANLSAEDRATFNPYLFTLEGRVKRIGIRVGFGRDHISQSELPGNANGNARFDRDTTHSNFRVGLMYVHDFGEKWTFKVGADYSVANEKRSYTSFLPSNNGLQDETTTIDYSYRETGFNPFFYVQYHFGPHISLGTELYFTSSGFASTEREVTTGFTSFDRTREKEGNRFFVTPPTALFLVVRF